MGRVTMALERRLVFLGEVKKNTEELAGKLIIQDGW